MGREGGAWGWGGLVYICSSMKQEDGLRGCDGRGAGVDACNCVSGSLGDDPSERPRSSAGPGVVLVPSDLSEVSGYAVELGGYMAAERDCKLVLLYVSGDAVTEDEYKGLEKKLRKQARLTPSSVDVVVKIVQGDDVVEVVQQRIREMGAELVLLGSRSASDHLKFKDSKSLKVIREGFAPYIFVQGAVEREAISTVVIPMDYTDEDVRDFSWLARLARCHRPHFHILMPMVDEVAEEEMEEYLEANLEDLRGQLQAVGASFEEHTLDSDQEFSASIVHYAQGIEADLIVLTSTVDPRKPNSYMLEPHARRVLLHAGAIPVMIVNPRV